jgi:hypothetical protein|nr:MAG TPA: hypothetical protein [Caudoviricetes sp.]
MYAKERFKKIQSQQTSRGFLYINPEKSKPPNLFPEFIANKKGDL